MASSPVREDVGSVGVTVHVMGGGIVGATTVGLSAVSGTATGMYVHDTNYTVVHARKPRPQGLYGSLR